MMRLAPAFLEEDSNGWLMTFSDLVLQLFAFAMVAVALGGRDDARLQPVVSVSPAVAVTAPERPLARPDALSLARFDDAPEPGRPEALQAAAAAPAVPTAPAPPSVPRLEPASPSVPAPPPVRSLAAELEAFVAAAGLEEVVQVAVNGGGVTLSISDTIGFASGSAELLPDAAPVLVEVREIIAARPDLVVEVAGHTDDRPVHGGVFASNLELSLARAARVAHELAAGAGDLAERIFASGYGPQRPVASNAEPAGRARNRRVEIRLVSAAGAMDHAPAVETR